MAGFLDRIDDGGGRCGGWRRVCFTVIFCVLLAGYQGVNARILDATDGDLLIWHQRTAPLARDARVSFALVRDTALGLAGCLNISAVSFLLECCSIHATDSIPHGTRMGLGGGGPR